MARRPRAGLAGHPAGWERGAAGFRGWPHRSVYDAAVDDQPYVRRLPKVLPPHRATDLPGAAEWWLRNRATVWDGPYTRRSGYSAVP